MIAIVIRFDTHIAGHRKTHARLLKALMLLAVVGCSNQSPKVPGRSDLAGTVYYHSQRLGGGEITVVSKENTGSVAVGVINSDGTFLVRNAPEGPVRIGVSTESMLYGGDRSRYVELPKKYRNHQQSGLTAEVKADGNEPIELRIE